MNVSQINNVGFGNTKLLDRRILQKGRNKLKNLSGPYEVKEANEYLRACVAGNAVIAASLSQVPMG